MPAIHPLKPDALLVAIGPQQTYTLRRPQLRALLSRSPKARPDRIPLLRGREGEAGEVTLSPTGRAIIVRTYEPDRRFLASAREARSFLDGNLSSLLLHEGREEDAEGGVAAEARRERIAQARARLHAAARNAHARLAGRTSPSPQPQRHAEREEAWSAPALDDDEPQGSERQGALET